MNLDAELLSVGVERFTAPDYRPGEVTHIVLFRYAPEADRAGIRDRFHALAESDRIVSIASGPQASAESDRFDDAFVVTFASLGDRNFYVGEPVVSDPRYYDRAHHDFKQFVGAHLAAVEVFDIESPRVS